LLNVPAGHLSQIIVLDEKEPAEHAVQDFEPVPGAIEPLAHVVQEDSPLAACDEPAGHIVHVTLLMLSA
jgi:hypothetical protein